MIRRIPLHLITVFRARLNDRPDIRLPGQLVLRLGAKIGQYALGMGVKSVHKPCRENKKPATESPVNAIHAEGVLPLSPTPWQEHLGVGFAGIQLRQTV